MTEVTSVSVCVCVCVWSVNFYVRSYVCVLQLAQLKVMSIYDASCGDCCVDGSGGGMLACVAPSDR